MISGNLGLSYNWLPSISGFDPTLLKYEIHISTTLARNHDTDSLLSQTQVIQQDILAVSVKNLACVCGR